MSRLAVSYDPVNRVAAASLNGQVIATLPYTTSSIKYVDVEGSWFANVNNFTVQTGAFSAPVAAVPAQSATAGTTSSTFSRAKVTSLASATIDPASADVLPA